MAKLTPEQIKLSKSWLYDIFVLANVQNSKFPHRDSRYYKMNYGVGNSDRAKKAATTIVDMIKFRPMQYVKFTDTDGALEVLEDCWFSPVSNYSRRTVRKTSDMLARYIANFCAENKIYWDNTLATPYEMDAIKNTIFGKAIWDYQCFVTQDTTSHTVKNTVTRTSNQPPQNNYKSLGGLSDKVSTLVGSPNDKTYINTPFVYCIEANKLGKNTPSIFVTPISNSGQTVSTAKAAKINLGSGNGYSDCKLWWDDLNAANDALSYCITMFSHKYQNIHVAKALPDKNGYFKVNTDLGEAYIKASKLNEEIIENLIDSSTEDQNNQNLVDKKKSKLTKAYAIQNIDVYSEAFDKYRD